MHIRIQFKDGSKAIVDGLKSIETFDFQNNKKIIDDFKSFTLNDLNGFATFIGSTTIALRIEDVLYLNISNNH